MEFEWAKKWVPYRKPSNSSDPCWIVWIEFSKGEFGQTVGRYLKYADISLWINNHKGDPQHFPEFTDYHYVIETLFAAFPPR